ncbi:MAG: hypothetical protein KatS3mg023_1530 [Armatimonadota bacterium]|nr:MAG: hypothetical protein KatS3mg023_1530 [Armatimonadota bacterium]
MPAPFEFHGRKREQKHVMGMDMFSRDVAPWEQYSDLLDNLTTALLVLDNGVVVYANPAAARWTGRGAGEELRGLPLSSLLPPECYTLIYEACERLCSQNLPAIHLTGLVCTEEKRRRFLDAHVARLRLGERCHTVLLLYDQTRLTCALHLLEQRTQQLEALIQFSSRFVEVQTEEEVIVTLCDLLNCTLDFKYLSVYLRRHNGRIEKAIVQHGQVGWEEVEISLEEDDSRLSHVLSGKIPHFLSQDALREVSQRELQAWKQILDDDSRVFSNAVVPIRGRTQVLGALAVDRRDTSEPITESELSMLLTIGRYAGLALDNVRLMHQRQVAEERLRHLVQNLPVTVWELNLATRRLEFVSEYVEQWLGYTPEEWQANPGMYRSVVHPEDMETFERVIRPDVSSPPQPVEVRLRAKQGRWHWCRILWSLEQEDGRDPLVRGVSTDITEQKQAELQQLHLMRLRSLGEIASGVAHNFNNLLMGILGNAELLQTALQHDPELQRRAEMIAQLAHDASAIVKRMQGFYKLQPPTHRERVRLRALLEDVIESTRPVWHDLAGRRGAKIQVYLVAEGDPVVKANRSELHEVFTNLIINACDAMPAGGTITLRVGQQDGRAVVEVADTGVGMSPEVRERCFDAFFTTKGEYGSGLGLSVSYQIIARHSGQITVWSEVGKGTVFSVYLPIATESERVTGDPPQPVSSPHLRILTVDDDEAVSTAIKHLLEADGHRVTAVLDAESALAHFQPGRYDLVILDLGMPHLDGLSLARLLKEISPSIPIILLTGWGDQLREDKPPEVDLVLAKPVRRATLRAALLKLVRR